MSSELTEHMYDNLCTAVLNGQLCEVKKIIDQLCKPKGETIGNPGIFMNSYFQKSSPLVLAAKLGHTDIIKFLLSKLPQAQYIDQCSSVFSLVWQDDELHHVTALNVACIKGRLPIVKLLLAHKASLSIADSTGSVPLNEAAFHGHYDVVEYLCSHGADIHVPNDFGWEPHHVAVLRNHHRVFTCLVDYGANCAHCTPDGLTVLHIAAMNGHLDIVKDIVKRELKLNPFNRSLINCNHVPSPLCLAAAYCHQSKFQQKVVDFFLQMPTCTLEHQADAYLLVGVSHMINSKYSSAFISWEKAIKIIEEHGLQVLCSQNSYQVKSEIRTLSKLVELCGSQNPSSKVEMWYNASRLWERCVGFLDMTYWTILTRLQEELKILGMVCEKEMILLRGTELIDVFLLPNLFHGHILPENFEDFYSSWINTCFAEILPQMATDSRTSVKPFPFSKFMPFILKAMKGINTRFSSLSSKYECKQRSPFSLLEIVLKIFKLWLVSVSSGPDPLAENAHCIELGTEFVASFRVFNDGSSLVNHLITSTFSKELTLIDFLLRCGADQVHNNCLHTASRLCKLGIINLLLEYGAHIDAVDEHGQTPLSIIRTHHPDHETEFMSMFYSTPLSLQCLSAVAILDHGLSYDFLPIPVCQFISIHTTLSNN